ncbi:MAG: hypothetical protein QXI28_04100 [Candidatus Hadarchaeales archaeon]
MLHSKPPAIIILSVLLMLSVTLASAQDLGPFSELRNVSANINVELTTDGRCKLEITGSAFTEPSEIPTDVPISKADIGLKLSSPSPSVLRANISASIDFTELPSEVAGLSKESINALIVLSGIVGKSLGELLSQSELEIPYAEYPPEVYEITITKLECTRFSVSGKKMGADFVAEFSGSIPENVREGLPLEMKIQLEISESLIEINVSVSVEDGNVNVTFKGRPSTGKLEFSLSAIFDLPIEADKVSWSFALPPEYAIILETLENVLSSADISLKLKVPEGASVESLPSGYTTSDGNTFEWSGSAAQNALLSMLGGQSQASISYVPSKPKPNVIMIGVAAAIIVVVLVAVAIILKKR